MKKYKIGMILILALVFLMMVSVVGASVPSLSGGKFNTPGNVLISDQFNNRVIEVNPSTKEIVWSFGTGNPLGSKTVPRDDVVPVCAFAPIAPHKPTRISPANTNTVAVHFEPRRIHAPLSHV